jgi:quinol-cytochrome oxidoreductase complex cytochrome b subunit
MPPDGSSNPLDRTPDMANLSASERARIYKERAAAAGIGRPPAAGQEGAAPTPAAPPPAAAEPAAPAEGPAPAARPAAGAGAAGLTPEQRQRLAAAVQRGPATAPAGAPAAATAAAPSAARSAQAADQSQRLVYVWPHLVTIEFLASVVLLVSMIAISMIIQAPLEGHANTDKTPNPSKAPWYFLNLQELLLHMHPALAGVLIPAGALALIAIIPYFDRDTRDVGKWFGTPKAMAIAWFTTWYTTIVLLLEVIFDEEIGVKPMMTGLAQRTGAEIFAWPSVVNVIVPMIFMNVPIAVLVWLIHKIYRPNNARDWMICLFTGFFVSYIVLTIVGTFLRGQGMHLMWPWDARMIRVE